MFRKFAIYTLLFFALLVVAFLCGPRVRVDATLKPVDLPVDLAPSGLREHIARQEAPFEHRLIDGAEKTIQFRYEDQRKTEFSLVHIHGFSACRQDCRPIPERVAEHLDANVFYTRLSHHGLENEEFAQVDANDWLNDVHEAVEIAKRLGNRVVVMGHSTGATLGLWRVNMDQTDLAAVILLSPNFGVTKKNAHLVLYPWGMQIARLISDPYQGFEPQSPEHALYWTERYRVEAAVEVVALADFCSKQDYSDLKTPTFCVYSENDAVVSLPRLKEQWTRVSGRDEWLCSLPGSKGHGLAGDILCPATTEPLVKMITSFLDEAVDLKY